MVMNMNYYAVPGLLSKQETKVKTNIKKAEKIMQNICDAYEIPFKVVKGKSRKSEIVYVRQWCIWMALTETGASLKSLGHLLCRDHTTMIHNRDTVRGYLYSRVENQYKKDYLEVKKIALNGIELGMGRPEKRKTYRKNKELEFKEVMKHQIVEETVNSIVRPQAIYSNKQWI